VRELDRKGILTGRIEKLNLAGKGA
jgi:hypothetical protein